MSARAKKIILLVVIAALLFSSGQLQKSLNHDRAQLGLTRVEPLENAPPMLAFTTVALGGFRGLISNFLWIRANDLQQDDKFFEAVQLASWITDLEPHFPQVWIFEAWNMAYNISIKFKDFPERWRWVENGFELLRDKGLVYNPDEISMYQQLGWIFQHKIGQNLDDANQYFKQQWALEMMPFFGSNGTNLADLLQPQTTETRSNALVLRDKFKMDPQFALQVNNDYGPLDWRLPEAQAIYWYARGLEQAKRNPTKVKTDDIITLRRGIYQSMLQAFHHGELVFNPFDQSYELYPNLDIISRLNAVSEEMMQEDSKNRDNIATFHKNFLKDAVYFLYENNRIAEAAKWYRYLGQKYPDKPLLVNNPNSLPSKLTLDEYAIAVVQEDVGETSQERVTSAIQGLLSRSYYELVIGQDDRAAGFKLLAQKVYQNYEKNINKGVSNQKRIGLAPFKDINQNVLDHMLDPQGGMPYAARAVLRTQLHLLPETNAVMQTISTNTLAPSISATNSPPTNSVTK
ncbi:MAG TPA: hypothetical protein VHG71_04440 [Verrucomicrobiae bacterium]|nr:hypothetical protein [Verrucomicrobiae bacterium]